METKINPTPGADGAEARFKEMMQSNSFARLETRIMAELERAQHSCERGVMSVEVRRAQGAVAAFRTALALPAVILGELQDPKRAGDKTGE